MPLYAHEGSDLGASQDQASIDTSVDEPRSLTGIELLGARASAVVEALAAQPEVARAFKAGSVHLIADAERQRSADSAAISTLRVIPAEEWTAAPVFERDLTNIASQPIPAFSTGQIAVVVTVIAPSPLPPPPSDADVPPPFEPVVKGGVVALNLMLTAAMTIFERFSSVLHMILFIG